MSTDFNLFAELHDQTLVIKTEGYINNTGGEKIVQEFAKHSNINKLVMNLEGSKVVNSIGISHLIEIIESSPDTIIQKLTEAGDSWMDGRNQDDDITFVVIRVK